MDEPTASLDPENVEILIDILRSLAQSGLTVALSSQDMNFVRRIFDRVYYLDAGTVVELCDDQERIAQCPAINSFISTDR